jgi:hypothetical protein
MTISPFSELIIGGANSNNPKGVSDRLEGVEGIQGSFPQHFSLGRLSDVVPKLSASHHPFSLRTT